MECPVQLQVEFYVDSYVGSRLRLPRQEWLNASFTYLWLVTSLTSLLSGNTTRDSKYDNIRRNRCSITKPTEKSDSPRNSDLFEKKIITNGAFLTILASKGEDIKNQIWWVGGDYKALFTNFVTPQIPSNPQYQTLNDCSLITKPKASGGEP